LASRNNRANVTSASTADGEPRPTDGPLTAKPYPEIVLGMVGPAGVDLEPVIAAFQHELEAVQYKVKIVRLSKKIESFFGVDYSEKAEDTRLARLMDAGTKLREKSGRGDAVALLGIAEIKRLRKAELKSEADSNAFILRSLKHPHEVQTLRSVYGRGFFLVSVYSPRESRVSAMAEKITRSQHGNPNNSRAKAEAIVERDELEENKSLGQDVKDAFPLADLFLDGRDKGSLELEIRRFVELTFGHLFHTPTRDEHGMYHARSAALRSADLGRQVGAAIATAAGELLAVGCNDVPKAGGDLYWPGDEGDARDFQRGFDPIVSERRQIFSELLSGLRDAGVLGEQFNGDEAIAPLTNQLISGAKRKFLKQARVMNLLEFGRSVHAEMAAISSAARLGLSIKGATLFTTTFPCHMCARHIVASGIDRVVYVEPYPKSKAKQLHGDAIQIDPEQDGAKGKVTFEPFVGIAPRQYQDIFDARNLRKDDAGNIFNWEAKGMRPEPRFIRFANTYRDIEEGIVAVEIPRIAKALKIPLKTTTRGTNEKRNVTSRSSSRRSASRKSVERPKT
jgi:deoxycytidylate deaminase